MGKEKIELRWPKYCRICGRKNPINEESGYSETTGKPVVIKYYSECDVIDCKHGYHVYEGFFKTRCKYCGQKMPSGNLQDD